jgi:predicted ABC-type transport system involved in lysophospholipase L1 biosynthesis ATPase subunit
VALPALLGRPRETQAAYRTAAQLLDQVGLAGYADAYPMEVSSGEQRRAVLARALINAPSLLLADEPTSDLDEQTEVAIMDWLKALNRSGQMTLIMVTHNLRLTAEADRTLQIANGSLVS